MPKRLALFIGISNFEDSSTFAPLSTPANDASDLAATLKNFGEFQIMDILIDVSSDIIRRAIDDLFSVAERGDLVLLYYSGHGYRDRIGQHYLVSKDSYVTRMRSTAISASFIHEAMEGSRSRHKIVILDCCFSGAFIKGRKSGTEPLLLEELKGEATAILASSGTIQYSFESANNLQKFEEIRNSLFTQHLIGGIKSGLADENEDGRIGLEELFNYAEQKVRYSQPGQTPMKDVSLREGEIILTINPRGATRLPNDLTVALQSSFIDIRLAAVNQLGQIVTNGSGNLTTIAYDVLRRLSENNDDLIISVKAKEIIGQLISFSKSVEANQVIEPEMIRIPAGNFIMGTDNETLSRLKNERFLTEAPQHTIYLPTYEIGQFPVTILQYKTFVKATGHSMPAPWRNKIPSSDLDAHPVVQVSWRDTQAYCEWLAKSTGKPYRLPTEEEWEKAARGIDGRIYPWGNKWDEKFANTQESNFNTTTPVGFFSPQGDSPFGCTDMAGNVWEWTNSILQPYPGSNFNHADYEKKQRVLRGGAFRYNFSFVRCACRGWTTPDYWVRYRGFRVALTPS